jgi:hypothetical protein
MKYGNFSKSFSMFVTGFRHNGVVPTPVRWTAKILSWRDKSMNHGSDPDWNLKLSADVRGFWQNIHTEFRERFSVVAVVTRDLTGSRKSHLRSEVLTVMDMSTLLF